ncbi:MAG: hypothetical protein M3P04_00180 [Actinomycetota bacterium]|nr:hypothetical protein [Actinomycetota bacterium]
MKLALLRAQWDRAAAWVAAGLGVLLLTIGWFGVSGTAYPAEQIPYLASAGLGALFLLGLAGTLWIGADLRDEYSKLDEIARLLAEQSADTSRAFDSEPSAQAAAPLTAAAAPAEPRRRSREPRRSTAGA